MLLTIFSRQTETELQEHKQQAKLIFRRITPNSEPKCSIESGAYTLQYAPPTNLSSTCWLTRVVVSYLIADNVVYLTIAEKSYPRKLAFSYLDELSKEFAITYGPKVETARKPYAFVGFGECGDASRPFGRCGTWSFIYVCLQPYRYIHVQNGPLVS